MPWTYIQSTGALLLNGVEVGSGYSGMGDGLDNPAMQNVPDVGPIPEGDYSIGPPFNDPHKGPVVMILTPNASNEMFGRAGFMMHGDNQEMNHTASLGCIILDRSLRDQVSGSGDTDLNVTA